MVLIDREEATKQIRGNKEYVADCQWLKGYNKACEDNAQIVEQMEGPELRELSVEEFVMDVAPQEYPTESLLHIYSDIHKMGCVICVKRS